MRFLLQIGWRLTLFLSFCLGINSPSFAQVPSLSNQRQILVSTDTICDSLTIIPNSLVWDGQKLDTSAYLVENNCIYLLESSLTLDSAMLSYRVFPIDLRKQYQWISASNVGGKQQEIDIEFDFTDEESTDLLGDMKGLDYQGSFARGFSLGNNQSLVLNSSFNLQMAGKIANDLEIKAAITDENIPIQPEGNTQELREFDKIFIQLLKGQSSLTAGDYELESKEGFFLNYFKKLQGITAATSIKTGTNSNLSVKSSIAIPKGQFARNQIVPIEGNQGPYALQGNNGERFLIVQSATERVFLDGKLLKRGVDEDYVIDYNRGTLTFTPKNLITKDKRIVIDFEYANQQFQRSFMAADAVWTHKKWHLFVQSLSQKDSKLTGGARDLSKDEKLSLAQAGDDLSLAFVSGIDTATQFTAERITYKLTDTLGYSNVLVFSKDQSQTLYTARFSDVGLHKGNYIISQSAVNGRAYEWVAPVFGEPQGNYEPIIPLVAPEKYQAISIGGEVQLGKNLTMGSEVSLSQKDLNRFSDKDQDDDFGVAAKLHIRHLLPFGKSKQASSLETTLAYQWIQSSYQSINPFRKTEFNRDWNVSNGQRYGEQLPAIILKYSLPKWGKITYHFDGYQQQNHYDGKKHQLSMQMEKGGFRWISSGSLLHSKSSVEQTSFFRPKTDISFRFLRKHAKKPGRMGFVLEQEDNQRFAIYSGSISDSLTAASNRFHFYKMYVNLPSNDKFQSGFHVSQRVDYLPGRLVNPSLTTPFLENTKAIDVAWNGRWRASASSNLQWQFTRRQLSVIPNGLSVLQPQNTWLGKLDYFFKLPKGLLVSTTTYEIGSGQTPKLQYSYLKVEPGQGSFTWIDRNQDSIPQLNEFEVAPFSDQADYMRVSVATNEFVATNNIRFNQSLRINPKRYWQKSKGPLKLIRQFSTISLLRIFQRLQTQPDLVSWNPFAPVVDSALVTNETSVVNTLFFRKGNPKIEGQLGWKNFRNKSLLTSGGESRLRKSSFSKWRYRITRSINLKVEGEQSYQENLNELFLQRNYTIEGWKGSGDLTHVYKRRLRNVIGYSWAQKANQVGSQETLVRQEGKWELTLTGKTNPLKTLRPVRLRANFSYVQVAFDGPINSPVSYTLLEGLQPGKNLLWGLSLDKQLTKSVILSVLYNGRQTGANAKIIHTGSMQARALF